MRLQRVGLRLAAFATWVGLALGPLHVAHGQQQGSEPPGGEGPRDAIALFDQGTVAYEDGRFEEALQFFEAAFRAASPEKRIYILYNIGLCHDQLGHVEQALEHFRQYLRLVPEGPRHRWVRGRVRLLQGRLAEREGRAPETGGQEAGAGAAGERGAGSEPPAGDGDAGREAPAAGVEPEVGDDETRRPEPIERSSGAGADVLASGPELAGDEEPGVGAGWVPWAVGGGLLAIGGVVAVVLLLGGGGGGDPAAAYTFGHVETLR